MPIDSIESLLKLAARGQGFGLVGIARAAEADGFSRFEEWLDRGYAGDMAYMHRHGDARRHPDSVFPEVKSVIVLGMRYGFDRDPQPTEPNRGRIAAYARGPDYHDLLRGKLNELLAWLQEQVPGCRGRGVVDTAPLLERDFARRAGLGWFGKNTMLINKREGSFFFLAALLVDLELQPDPPHEATHCGSCTRCLQACPTGAFPQAGWLDARKCISYLTIELRTAIPEELRPQMGDWLFGCDICQQVCPWNNRPAAVAEFPHQNEWDSVNLIELLNLDESAFRLRFRGTAMTRAKWRGMMRNAAIALGNAGDLRAVPVLEKAAICEDSLVAEAANWALSHIYSRHSHGPGFNHLPMDGV